MSWRDHSFRTFAYRRNYTRRDICRRRHPEVPERMTLQNGVLAEQHLSRLAANRGPHLRRTAGDRPLDKSPI
jgi:hypothetical protein